MLVTSGKNLVILHGSCGKDKKKRERRKEVNFNWKYSLSEGFLQIHSHTTHKALKVFCDCPFHPCIQGKKLVFERLVAWATTVTIISLKVVSTCSGRVAADHKSDRTTTTEHLLHCVRRYCS